MCDGILRTNVFPRTAKTHITAALIFIEFVIEMIKNDRRVFFARRRTLCTVQMYTYVYILERYIHIIYIGPRRIYAAETQCKYLVHRDIEKRETLFARCPRLNPYLSEGRQNRHEGSLSTNSLMTLQGTFAGKW